MAQFRNLLSKALVATCALALSACVATVPGQEGDQDDDGGSGDGTLVIQVQGDAGVNLRTITVDIASVEARPEGADWMLVEDGVGEVALVDTTATLETIAQEDVDQARFDAIRLTFNGGFVVDGEGDQVDLNIPDESAKLIIETAFCVKSGATTTVVLDFNAEENIEDAGDTYTMVPAVVVADNNSCDGF